MSDARPLLEVEDLRIVFPGRRGETPVVHGISFHVQRGRTLALVGESGSGKSLTGYAVMGLVPPPGRVTGGSIRLHSAAAGSLEPTRLRPDAPELRRLRGGIVSMIFQEPMTALSPVHRVGEQVAEAMLVHRRVSTAEARAKTIEMLRRVGIGDPERRVDAYPHELSGGMRQRVVIAMALVCRPELLIADEPTTALDVTIQAQILGLIKSLQREIGCAVLLITHDFGVVAQMADEVAVMHRGEMVEYGAVREVLKNPQHARTQALLDALPGRRMPA